MISHGYWERRFGGDPKVIGRRVMADGVAREIIGVLPRDFWFMDMGHDVILPLRYDRSAVHLAGYNFRESLACVLESPFNRQTPTLRE